MSVFYKQINALTHLDCEDDLKRARACNHVFKNFARFEVCKRHAP